jgi:hypothetical protein
VNAKGLVTAAGVVTVTPAYGSITGLPAAIAALDDLTPAADRLPYFISGSAAALATFSAFGRSLVDDADAATARATLGLGTAATSASTAFQAADAELTAIAGLASAADRLPYFTGSGTAALATFSSFGRTLVDDADAATARTTLGVGAVALLVDQPVGVSTSYTVNNSTITRAFGRFELSFAGLSHNSGAPRTFRMELSGDNGSSWSTPVQITDALIASETSFGSLAIDNAGATGSASRVISSAYGAVSVTVSGAINAIRLSPSAGSFDAGTLTLIGLS